MEAIARYCSGFCTLVLAFGAWTTADASSPWQDLEAFESHRVTEQTAAPFKPVPKNTSWGGWYAGMHAGGVLVPETNFAGNGSELLYDFDNGFALGGSFGYGFDFGLRFDSEVTYRVTQADKFETLGATFSGSGNLDTLSMMLNSWFDIKFLSFLLGDFVPYVGAGAGIVHAWSNVGTIGVPLVEARDFAFAWQGAGGLAYRISDSIFFGVDYRFFRTFGSFSFDDSAYAEPFKAKYKVHTITLGFRGFF